MERLPVGVLGLGRSGLAAARLALAAGYEVYASDAGDSPALRAAAEAIRAVGGRAETGGHTVEELARCLELIVSPGIRPTAAVLRDPRLQSIPLVSELEFGFRHLDAPVIAITGTNGKSTTTAWAAHLLQAAGLDAPAAGNIGIALSEVALRTTPPDWVVVEASSFQLADIETFRPTIGALTNLAPDHLDRYPSVQAYYRDKSRLFDNASPASQWILNAEDAAVVELAAQAPGTRYWVRVASLPAAAEMGGHVTQDGELVVRTGDGEWRLGHTSDLPLLGAHNRANALTAAIAAVLAGAAPEGVGRALATFQPLSHRLEPVADREGVLWINDSKATNVASSLVALRSMERPTVLLLGGRHKGEPYHTLLPELRRIVKAVVAYGEAAELIERELSGEVRVVRVDGSFEEVVGTAGELAAPGDVVLLAPACASYDMFRDFEERGRRFAVLAAGEPEGSHVR